MTTRKYRRKTVRLVPTWLWILVAAQGLALVVLGVLYFFGADPAKMVVDLFAILAAVGNTALHAGQLSRSR